MLVSKNAEICVNPNANFKICVTPNEKPQLKSVEHGVGSQMQNSCVGHVHFILFGDNFIRVGYRFSVEYGLMSVNNLVIPYPKQVM